MSKFEKNIGRVGHTDAKREAPPISRHAGAKRNKKDYPPHWKVRGNSIFGFHLEQHRGPHAAWYAMFRSSREERPDRKDLQAILDWYAERFPETMGFPVRFIDCQEVTSDREILKS